MAWPLDRILDCIANVTVVTAALLNGLQDWIVDWSLGRVSALAVTADGTGGQTINPTAGDVRASHDVRASNQVRVGTPTDVGAAGDVVAQNSLYVGREVASNTVPCPGINGSEMPRSMIPVAWGRVRGNDGGGNAVLVRGVGVQALTRDVGGRYYIDCRAKGGTMGGEPTKAVIVAMLYRIAGGNNNPINIRALATSDQGGLQRYGIECFDENGVLRDGDFMFVAYGGD